MVLGGDTGTAPGQSAQKGLGSLSTLQVSDSGLYWYFSPTPRLGITWLGPQETF